MRIFKGCTWCTPMLFVLHLGAASALLLSPDSTLAAVLAGLFCYGAALAVRTALSYGAASVLSGLLAAAGTVCLHGGFWPKEEVPAAGGGTAAVLFTLPLLAALAAGAVRASEKAGVSRPAALPRARLAVFLAAWFLLGAGRLLAFPPGPASAAVKYDDWGGAVLLLGGTAPLVLALIRLPAPSALPLQRSPLRDPALSAVWTAAALLAPPLLLSLLPLLLTGAYGVHPLLSGWCSLTLLLILLLRRRPGTPAASEQAAEAEADAVTEAPSGGTLEEALLAFDSAGASREEAGGLSVVKPLLRGIAGLLGGAAAVVLRYGEGRTESALESIEEGMEGPEARRAAEEERAGYLRQVIMMDEPVTGYLILKGPVKEQALGREEGERLALLLSSLRFALENVILARGLSLRLHELAARMPHEVKFGWLRRALIDGQERERLRFASDLHDTTAQDLIYVRSRLLPLLERLPEGSEEARLAASAAGHLELMNENLRQTLFELSPLQLQHLGLTGALQKLAGLEQGMQEAEIEFRAEEAARLEQLPSETKRQLFRLVQELLNNARKHADASRIAVELSAAEPGKVRLHYTDDGSGFDPDAAAERAGLGGISSPGLGLLQMRSRVLLLEGSFELVSSPGHGVQVTIQIPVKEVHAV